MPKKPFQRGQKFRPIFSLGMSHLGVVDHIAAVEYLGVVDHLGIDHPK